MNGRPRGLEGGDGRREQLLAVPLHALALAIVINVLWGGNPVGVKFSLVVFPPLWTGFYRFLVAVLAIAAFARLTGVRIWPHRDEWPGLVVLGLLFTVQIGLMNVGYDRTTAALGSIIIATNPLFAALAAHHVLPDDRMTVRRTVGLLVAFGGTALVLLRGEGTGELGAAGNWIVLASAALLGSRLIFSARLLRRVDEVRVAIWQMLISLPLFAAGGLAFETIAWEHLGPAPVAGLLYQGLVIGAFGFMASFWLMKRYTPSVIVGFNFVSPVAGVLLGAWLLGEPTGPWMLAGLAAVAAGLILVARR